MSSTRIPRSFPRRPILAATLLGALGLAAGGAQAADAYPSQPIKMLVGFAAGGANDILARVIAKELQQGMGQTVVVENRPGAGGLIAADAVAKAPATGYTLLLGSTGSQTIAPALSTKIGFDPRKGLAPVSLVAESGNALLVNAKLPYRNVAEVIAAARKEPGVLNYASSGTGSTLHLAGALFARQAGIQITHVPYKGNSQAITDLAGGQVQMSFSGIPPAISSAKTGQTRILAVTTAKRLKSLPEVPTVAESGLPGYEFSTWYGLLTTGGTDPAIVARLAQEVKKALAKPEVVAIFEQQGVEPMSSTPQAFSAQIDRELTRWARDIKAFGITVD
jgi:tripartite-type tricarboxylate transporter receptor subunit TctC